MTWARNSRRGAWLSGPACIALACAANLLAGAYSVWAGVNVWTSNGPPGPWSDRVNVIASDPATPATVYAGTGSGDVFKSIDGGNMWRSTGLAGAPVWALAIDPSAPLTVYAGSVGNGVFKSTDGGGTWHDSNTGLTDLVVHALAVAPSLPSTLYAGTFGGGVFKSTDGGATWTPAGLATHKVLALAVDPNSPETLWAGVVDVGIPPFGTGVYRSSDGGNTWMPATGIPDRYLLDGGVQALASHPTDPGRLYAALWGGTYNGPLVIGNVFESTDFGATWTNTALVRTEAVVSLALDPGAPGTLYAGTEQAGVWKTTDGGATWNAAGLLGGSIYGLAVAPGARGGVYAGLLTGLAKSADGGQTWRAGLRLAGADVTALAIDPAAPERLYAGTTDGLYASTDRGSTWSAAPVGLAGTRIDALAVDSPAMYAGTTAGALKSPDGGTTWSAAGLSDRSINVLVADPGSPPTLYAGTSSGLFKSTDDASSWSAVGLADTNVFAIAVDRATRTTLYALAAGCIASHGCLFKSTDGGGTWTDTSPDTAVNALVVDPRRPATLYVGTGICGTGPFGGGCSGDVLKSTDGGSAWIPSGAGLPDKPITLLAIDPADPRTLYAGWSGGVFKSSDSGEVWTDFSTGLSDSELRTLSVDPTRPSRLYAGTHLGGVFAIAQIGVVGDGTPASCTEAELDRALAVGGLVTFNCGPDPVTITLSSEKVIRGTTTIDGEGRITLSGGGEVRIFSVDADAGLELRNLTIADGADNPYDIRGGGIFNAGILTLTNCTMSGNAATVGGGAIHNAGTATLTNCTLRDNSATGGGGAIANSGAATLTNCTLRDNTAGGGGGISNAGTATLTNCTLSDNSADDGGGIWNAPGGCFGCTGGVAGTLTLRNTIVANSPSGGDCRYGIIDGGHNLIEDSTYCGDFTDGVNGNLVAVDPLLDPEGLKDNGGPTKTIALLPASPVINAGDTAVCAAPPVNDRDQRGYVRPGSDHPNCSIGAYETDATPSPACTGDCNGTYAVAVSDILKLVNLSLTPAEPDSCPAGHPTDKAVTSAHLIIAVDNFLVGCPKE